MRGPHIRRNLLAAALLAAATLVGTVRPAAADAGDEANKLLDTVRAAAADGRQKASHALGFTPGKEDFTDSPSQPGFLVGFDLGLGKNGDGENIFGLRAVFWTPGGDEVGKDHGLWRDKIISKKQTIKSRVQRVVHVRAADGYAVGGLTLRSGLDINGMSVTFMRIKDGKLDPQDSYESDWVGEKRGGEGTIGGEGAPVVAVIGNQDSEKICALGLTFTTMPAAAVSPPANAQPPGREAFQPPPAPARTPANPPPVIAPIDDPPARHDAPAQPPAAPAADNAPAQPPAAAAVEPAPEAPAAPAKRAVVATPAEQAAANPVLTYAVPAAAFLSIAGLIGLAVVTTIRRRNQAARRPANRPSAPRPPVAQAAPLDYTGILERPLPRAVPLPAYHGEVLELQPEDFLPDPPPAADHAPAPKPAPASSDDWPRLEL